MRLRILRSRPAVLGPASITELQTVGFPDGLRHSGNPHPGPLPVEITAQNIDT